VDVPAYAHQFSVEDLRFSKITTSKAVHQASGEA
jgi:hypothetical protein